MTVTEGLCSLFVTELVGDGHLIHFPLMLIYFAFHGIGHILVEMESKTRVHDYGCREAGKLFFFKERKKKKKERVL